MDAPLSIRVAVLVSMSCVLVTCKKSTSTGPTDPSAIQPNLVVAVSPTPLTAAHVPADPDTKYRIPANLTFRETAGLPASITRLQVTVTGVSGWSSSAAQSVEIALPARGTAAYTLISVVDIGGADTSATWRLDVTAVGPDAAAIPVGSAQSELRIVDPPIPDAVLVGAGDMAGCGREAPIATAALLDRIPGTVFTAGDNVYPSGSDSNYRDCYGPNWGRHLSRTYPIPGNHDWDSSVSAAAYFHYFGPVSAPVLGYYSYSVGAWHIVALNSNIIAQPNSAQYEWLKADLAASATPCMLAVWHHPLYSSSINGNSSRMREVWRLLQQWGVEVVVNGHDHTYERFAPQDASGRPDAAGLREFVVGTGGYNLYDRAHTQPNSEVFENRTFGVIKFTLKRQGYEWEFIPIDGQSFRDYGSGTCSPLPPR